MLIGTDDVDRLAAYYTSLFGAPGWAEGGYHGWQLGDGYLVIGAHSGVQGRSAHPGRVIWNLETADVRGDFARLVGAGARVIREPYSMGGGDDLIATLADPVDNYFQLTSPMPG